MKESFFKDANRIFHGTFELWFSHLGRNNRSTVMFGPVCIIFIERWMNPVIIGNNSLFAVITNNDGWNSAVEFQRIIVYLNPLWLFCRYHTFRVNHLWIRKNCNKNYNVHDLSSQPVNHFKGLTGEIHLHGLSNHMRKMGIFLIVVTPHAVTLAELPIGIILEIILFAFLFVPIPLINERHVLPWNHLLVHLCIVWKNKCLIADSLTGYLSINQLSNPIVGNTVRKRKTYSFALFKTLQEVIDSWFATAKILGNLCAG